MAMTANEVRESGMKQAEEDFEKVKKDLPDLDRESFIWGFAKGIEFCIEKLEKERKND